MKRALLHGLMAGCIMMLAGMLVSLPFNFFFPSLQLQYADAHLFRAWSDPLMWLCLIQPFILSAILAWIWDKSKVLFLQTGILKRGFAFAFVYWVLTLPGMLMTYGCFPVSLLIVVNWTVAILIQSLGAAWFFAKINP